MVNILTQFLILKNYFFFKKRRVFMLKNMDRVGALNRKLYMVLRYIFSPHINMYEIKIHLILKHEP